ncbi:FHA domain-containing protein [Streptomyces sp. NPDC001922]|uniref:FHA domain-containing protein n=1 Tax=Streptomyces sp. NPDC001922 TaxID=3364624 RepID=UPI00369CA3CC
MPTCPNGHQSGSDDWCEVCGHRMAGAGAPAGAVPPPPPPPPMPGAPGPGAPMGGGPGGYGYPNPATGATGPGAPMGGSGGYGYPNPGGHPNRPPGMYDPHATAQAELCPQCRTPREAQAPFCEECRYNFLTHSPTAFAPPSHQPHPGGPQQPHGFGQPPQPSQGHQGPPQGFDYQASRPSQMNRPAEPLSPQPQQQAPHGAPQQAPYQAPQPGYGSNDDWTLPPPAQPQGAPQAPEFGQSGGQPQAPDYGQSGGQPQAPDYGQPQAPDYGPAGQQPYPPQGAPAGPPAPPAPPEPSGTWVAVITPDREYFMAMMRRSGPEASGLNLPAYSPEQQLELSGSQVTIGRRRNSTGESPDIDLSRPPEDPGVSHQHALLVQQPDGNWAVVDQDSTNGTTINGGEEPIQPFIPVPLQDGDRVHVGAWTTITVRRG